MTRRTPGILSPYQSFHLIPLPLRDDRTLHLVKVLHRGSLSTPLEQRLGGPGLHHRIQLLQVPFHACHRLIEFSNLEDVTIDEHSQDLCPQFLRSLHHRSHLHQS